MSTMFDATDSDDDGNITLSFHVFKKGEDPKFTSTNFWSALSSEGGRVLAKAIVTSSVAGYRYDKPAFRKILKEGLVDFRYAMSTVSFDDVPGDVTAFIFSLAHALSAVPNHSKEWDALPIPDSAPPFKKGSKAPKFPCDLTDDDFNNAPHLDKMFEVLPRPSNKRKRVPTRSVSPIDVDSISKAGPSRNKGKGKGKEEDEKPKAKKSKNREVPPLSDADDADDAVGGSSRTARLRPSTKNQTERTKSAATKKDTVNLDLLLPLVRDALGRIYESRTKTFELLQFSGLPHLTVTLSTINGTRTIVPRSHYGDTERTRFTQTDAEAGYNFEPAPLINVQAVGDIPVVQALAPRFKCTPCMTFSMDCYPQGVGVACVSCNTKKVVQFCDHMHDAKHLAKLSKDLRSTREFMDPIAGEITAETLKEEGDLAVQALQLAESLRAKYVDHLRTYIESMIARAESFGAEGFAQLFEYNQTNHLDALNNLITAYNETMKAGAGAQDDIELPDAQTPPVAGPSRLRQPSSPSPADGGSPAGSLGA
ncbi:hypothetical protein B0H11DRAFT_2215244 [Mycena galericulata]|nr:hypothetical protein B0H11DRAFT_2215244 [Mycena galericulata]